MRIWTARNQEKILCVVLDTNVWRSSLLLRTPIGAALLYAVKQSGGYIGLPEVVEEETVKQITRAGLEATENIDRYFRTIEILMGSRSEYTLPTESEFETATKKRFDELSHMIIKVPFTLVHAKSAFKKILLDMPPNSPKNQQFKDSAIWEAVLELSATHDIHFVTSDSGFYRERDAKKGLALNLLEESDNIKGSVRIFNELPLCISALQESVPPLDQNQLATGIDNIMHTSLEEITAKRGFALRNMTSFTVDPFLTERAGVIAIEFKLRYDLEDISLGEEIRNEPSVVASGNCFFDINNKGISDIRQGSEEFTWRDKEGIQHQNKNVYASMAGFLGRRTITYTFREPLSN